MFTLLLAVFSVGIGAGSILCTALDAGELLCIFPEGQLTADGEVSEFRPGIMQLLETHPVPVYPVAL